jgi:hypothetical protein
VKKIPTMARVLPEVHPDCRWVLDGEGVPTRKYDGTCMLFDGEHWWARREVKKGKAAPANYRLEEFDENTGKSVGWEPVEQSSFAKFHAQALTEEIGIVDLDGVRAPVAGCTYELVGPKVNGNPENAPGHLLVRHGYLAAVDEEQLTTAPRTFDGLRAWLGERSAWEGIVWHHPDGRMAKLKGRDFPRSDA